MGIESFLLPVAGIALFVTVCWAAFAVSRSATRRLTRNVVNDRPEVDRDAGGGEIIGEMGLIDRARGGDLYPRDRDR